MTLLELVLIVIVVVLALLVGGGYVASTRRRRADDVSLPSELEAANEALAQARAEDKGWERSLLEEAARAAFAERSTADVSDLQLVQVVDRPGTADDQAVFRVVTDHGAEYLHLDRHGDTWVAQ